MTTERSVPDPRKRWVAPLFVFVALAGLVFIPTPPTCPVRVVLHVPCPSCGLTRATLLAFQGHFREAIAMHPLVFVLGPAVFGFAALETRGYLAVGRWGQAAKERWVTRSMAALAALAIVVWIARFFGFFGGPAPV